MKELSHSNTKRYRRVAAGELKRETILCQKYVVPAGLVIAEIVLVIASATDIQEKVVILALGILLLFGGLLMALIPQPPYVAQLSTTSGDVKAFISFDKSYIDQIVVALNSVIIQQSVLPTSDASLLA